MASKIIIAISVILLVAAFGLFIFLDSSEATLNEATGLVVSAESFPVYLETHPVFNELPKSAEVQINIGGSNYAISDSRVTAGVILEEPDVKVALPAGYESRIGEIGLCKALRESWQANELSVETSESKLKLLMKYRSLIKYRKCIE